MLSKPLVFLLLASLLSVAPATAQDADPSRALAGSRPGTELWLVHFAERPFDLAPFRAEMFGQRRPEVVESIVADLEKRMEKHQAAFVQQVEKLGGRVTHQYWLVNGCAIEIAPRHLARLRAFENVSRLEPDQKYAPGWIKTSTNTKNHATDLLHARSITGAGIAIAILDSGHDSAVGTRSRPHLLYSNRGSTTTSRLLFNKKIGSMAADDTHGHGTAVASVAAGWKWNSSTVSDHGHAYDAMIAGYAIANDAKGASDGATMTAAWQQVAKDAAANKILVANLSYEGSPRPLDLAQQALDSVAYNGDLLICTAAGNSGTSTANSQICVNGLSVANVDNDTHKLAASSSRGTTDGQVFPDIAASGGPAIYMAKRDDESSHVAWGGTSFASPQVAGIATLLRASNGALKADETKAVLLASTLDTPETQQIQVNGPGVGYLAAEIAHEVATNPKRHGRDTLTTTATKWERCLPVVNGKTYNFAIAWHRSKMDSRLWNELILEIYDDTTLVIRSANPRNTEQFVSFKATKDTTYTIQVTASLTGPIGWPKYPQTFGWACTQDTEPAAMDLTIDSHGINATHLKGGLRYQGTVTTKNIGPVASGSCNAGFYLSTDPVITTADRLVGAVPVPGLMPHTSDKRTLWFTMPAGLSGTLYFGAIADYANARQECNETNNASPGIKVTAEDADPDLQAGINVPKGTLVAGSTYDIYCSTDNRGEGTAGPSVMMINIGNRLVKKIPVPTVGPKKSFGGKYTVRVPRCIPYNTSVIIRVDVDVFSQVKESSEINNYRTQSMAYTAWNSGTGKPFLEYVSRLTPEVDLMSATLSAKAGDSAQICFRTPKSMGQQWYLLFWSFSKTPVVDAATGVSLSLLNSSVFQRWYGIAPVSLSPMLVLPKVPLSKPFQVYTHALVFPNTFVTEPLLTTINP